ncbi:hypothetical protein CC86DRAFT_143520 [Ophiobolus disseminans]|uniref:C2H2-type domain-containing protein n=1 Tax=Ophiobolus disseminans TaxID=1469910 RepID=A0A6A7AGI5_9PLEO|nr:hypothetical protein CC86DRAFT_143520 [Ophiobolus disseminans]
MRFLLARYQDHMLQMFPTNSTSLHRLMATNTRTRAYYQTYYAETAYPPTLGDYEGTEDYVMPVPTVEEELVVDTNGTEIDASPSPGPSSGTPPGSRLASNAPNLSIACPYRCGKVLTGVHALGNLTRHRKTGYCSASGQPKTKHLCSIKGCCKEYSRSDGCK